MTNPVGGWECPVPWCTYSDVLWSFVLQHIAREHPEESHD